MHRELPEALAQRAAQLQGVQPRGGNAARGGLALADLVAVDNQHPCATSRQLAGDREAREAGAAHQYIALALQAGALDFPAWSRVRALALNHMSAAPHERVWRVGVGGAGGVHLIALR